MRDNKGAGFGLPLESMWKCLSIGCIHNLGYVYRSLDYSFGKPTEKDYQLAGNNPIHRYKFFWYLTNEKPIQQPDEAFTTLGGTIRQYQMYFKKKMHTLKDAFILVSAMHGKLIQWNPWMRSRPPGWTLLCSQWHSGWSKTESGSSLDGNVYSFEKKKICNKTAGTSVAMQAQVLTTDQHGMASKLSGGDAVVFREHDDDV